MAKNDKLLLDGIIDDRIADKLPSGRRDEAFEYLVFEQVLKDYDLSREEIESGSVDGRDDGGIDGFFILINGHLLVDIQSFTWPRTGSQLEVFIITCKHHETFKQSPLDNLVASLTELLDFGISNEELKGSYSEVIIEYRDRLKLAYRKLSSRMSSFSLNLSYASRGDLQNIGDSVFSRAKQIEAIAQESFGSCSSSFTFYGCTELIELIRKTPIFSLEIPFIESLARRETYVLLTKLNDYYNFISDEGKLRRYLFDSNVRDFMGLNRVNEDIRTTLCDENSPDFWWLNNGVTILATSASIIGKSIQIQDIQIVNGLQTTESIFRYFEQGGEDSSERSVLIKVIVSEDEVVRDSIIRATNNQTDVEIASLHATDKIQRDIEDILKRSGFCYERRKNFYKNIGHTQSEIVTPLYLASGFINLILKSPYQATRLRSRFMQSESSYRKVFNEKTPLEVWPKVAMILKTTDEALDIYRPTGTSANEGFLKKMRQITSFLVVSKIYGNFHFSAQDLIDVDEESIVTEEIGDIVQLIFNSSEDFLTGKNWKKKLLFMKVCKEIGEKFSITNTENLEKLSKFKDEYNIARSIKVSPDFVDKVDELLPEQPWKPGIHKIICKQLSCKISEYFAAVDILIKEGRRNQQKDGVVYDSDGNVILFDSERVDPSSLELRDN